MVLAKKVYENVIPIPRVLLSLIIFYLFSIILQQAKLNKISRLRSRLFCLLYIISSTTSLIIFFLIFIFIYFYFIFFYDGLGFIMMVI